MDTVKHEGVRYHVGCGGTILKGVCVKCGERYKRSLMKRVFGEGPLILEEKDEKAVGRNAHRKRLRERRDIWK